MEITESQIESLAPNAAAVKNGRDLAAKNKFSNLHIDADNTIIWGDCAGSGKNPYSCSADFFEKSNPVFRCSCPSRQFPCKHGIGLLFAYKNGLPFNASDIPSDIVDKRSKIEKKQEKKELLQQTLKEKVDQPKRVNTTALKKKTSTQLTGIELAEKILFNIIQNGLSSIDQKERKNYEAQIKELGNYYISGIQTSFQHFLILLSDVKNEQFTPAIDQLNYIHSLLNKARTYLQSRLDNPDSPIDTSSSIEEQIGTIWKLTDLTSYGLYEEKAELMQLSFDSYDNPARREFVDEGIWINMKSGVLYKTKNYRPHRALKYVKEDNSFSDILQLEELFIYPGGLNQRIRWELASQTQRAPSAQDIAGLHQYASINYAELFKGVKNSIKNPLEDKNPVVLIHVHHTFLNGNDLVVEDANGYKLTLVDFEISTVKPTKILQRLISEYPKQTSLLVMLDNNITSGLFTGQPLSLIIDHQLVKLLY